MPEEVNVVVASEQVDVLAPPAEIRVSVGVGAPGTRGSTIHAGTQSPEVFFAAMGETPKVLDLYLSVTARRMYQFVSTPSGNVWSVLFDVEDLFSAGGYGTVIQETAPTPPTGAKVFWIQTDGAGIPTGAWIVTGE